MKRFSNIACVLAAAAALGLAGCASGEGSSGPSSVSNEDYASQYDYDEFRLAADGREFPVVLAGTPFAGSGDRDVPADLLAVLQSVKPRPRLVFTLAPAPAGQRPSYRLVLVFDPANDLTAARVCRQEMRFGTAVSGRVNVLAVYCRNDLPLSQAVGRTAARGADDPRLAALLRQVLKAVFSDAPYIRPVVGYPGGLL